jgi:hypothetical protein
MKFRYSFTGPEGAVRGKGHDNVKDAVDDCRTKIEEFCEQYKDGIEIEQIPVRAHIKTKFMEFDANAMADQQDDAMSQGRTSAEGQDDDLDVSQSQDSNYSESVVQGDDADNFWDEEDDHPPESSQEESRAENIITLTEMNEALERSYTGTIKQLGITSTIDGNTAETTKSLLTKGILHLRDLKIHKIRGPPLPQAINTLMNSVLQYGSLLSKLFENMLVEIDRRVVTQSVVIMWPNANGHYKHSICGQRAEGLWY